MAVSKEQKKVILEELREKIILQKLIILVGITGLKVKDLSALRKKLKGVNANIQVIKKTLANLVFKENNLDFSREDFKEELAFVFGFGDEILPAKAVYQLARENEKLKILGGFIANQTKSKEDMILLAQLPGKEQLLQKLVGSIASPISGFANVLQGNIKGLITVLAKIKT